MIVFEDIQLLTKSTPIFHKSTQLTSESTKSKQNSSPLAQLLKSIEVGFRCSPLPPTRGGGERTFYAAIQQWIQRKTSPTRSQIAQPSSGRRDARARVG